MIYPIGHDYLIKASKAFYSMRAATGKTPLWFVWILAVLLLVSAGVTYRVLASSLQLIVDTPVELPVPLDAFPTQVGDWAGKDLPIPAITKEYMKDHFADDFCSRRYFNSATNVWADVFIVYCSSRPGNIAGHRPRVCYPGHGWIHDSTESSQFISRAGRQVPCLIHRFHRPGPSGNHTVVLNFYVMNGRLTADRNDFTGLLGRRPNIAGDLARYVAQVQVSSTLENSVRKAAQMVTDLVLDFLPDEKGETRATEYANVTKSVSK